jgi:riboflavin kinase/FMN adenylyltransferase
MRVQQGSEPFSPRDRGAVLTIGNFDGVHLGHRAVILSAIERARYLGSPAIVYTFDPHPRRVLDPDRAQPLLMNPRQLELALEELGVDLLIRERFTPEFASLTPDAFLRTILHGRIGPRELFVGRDFHFGKGRGGSGETLVQMAPTLGIRVIIVAEVQAGERDVSSTRIRRSLALGDVEDARICLGRPYALWGHVVRGDERGHQLGFPTANLEPENEILPAGGVYATRVRPIDERGRPSRESFGSVTNVGTRPTFQKDQFLSETHLFDFEGDLYGKRLEVAFFARLRSEQRFADVEGLRRQIADDIERARAILGERPE